MKSISTFICSSGKMNGSEVVLIEKPRLIVLLSPNRIRMVEDTVKMSSKGTATG
jgi:hypothetical protein